MTERTLEKAIAIKKEIENARNRKEALEKQDSLCWGNTGDIRGRRFVLTVRDGSATKDILVNPESMRLAIKQELEYVNQTLDNRLHDLNELN